MYLCGKYKLCQKCKSLKLFQKIHEYSRMLSGQGILRDGSCSQTPPDGPREGPRMNHGRAPDEHRMKPGWTTDGPRKAPGWTPVGPRMDSGWTLDGPHKAHGWTPDEPQMDPGWTPAAFLSCQAARDSQAASREALWNILGFFEIILSFCISDIIIYFCQTI